MPKDVSKLIAFGFKTLLIEYMTIDLRLLRKVQTESEKRTIINAIGKYSRIAGKLSQKGVLQSTHLLHARRITTALKDDVEIAPLEYEPSDIPPPLLEIDKPITSTSTLFPYFDRLVRLESVDHLAPPSVPILRQVTIHLSFLTY
jgi:hypothetical protein